MGLNYCDIGIHNEPLNLFYATVVKKKLENNMGLNPQFTNENRDL